MQEEYFEVLVIDDEPDYARTLAKYIEKICHIKASYTTEPKTAKALISKFPIKVIIFDQRMSKTTGTALYQELRIIDKDFMSILITAQASREEICDATNNGFNVALIKEKDDYLISFKVLSLIKEYNDKKYLRLTFCEFYQAKIGGFFSQDYISYSIDAIHIIDHDFLLPDSWITVAQIHAGETTKIVTRREILSSYKDTTFKETNLSNDLIVNFGVPKKIINAFQSALTGELKRSVAVEKIYSGRFENTKTWSLELPADSDILYKRFEIAPVYIRLRVYIRSKFTWTKKTYSDFVELNLLTDSIMGRIFICNKNDKDENHNLGKFRCSSGIF